MSEEDLDIEQRQLCSDGNCTGVIGPDGRCKECGLSPEGPGGPAAPTLDTAPESPDSDDFDARQLCSDGSCTGLIGPDGRCKECGKSS